VLVSSYLPLVLLSGVAAFLVTPISVWAARRLGFVDVPQPHKIHVRPIPLLGGLAIYAALGIVLLLVNVRPAIPQLVGVVFGGTLVAALGLWDDRHPVVPWIKILLEIVAGLAVIAVGIHVQLLPWAAANVVITLFWIVGITNAINLMDNMDGLAAGVSAVAAVFFLLLASTNGQGLVASMAAAIAGASLGFLFYNINPALVFMGDSGSLLLGFLLAVLGMKYEPSTLPLGSTWMVPIVVLGLPIFDTALVTYARWRRHQSILRGGGDHTSHRLARLGLGTSRAVLTMYLGAVALGTLGIAFTHLLPPWPSLLFAILVGVGLIGVVLLEHTRPMLPGMRPIAVVLGSGDGLPALRAARRLSDEVTVVLDRPPSAEAMKGLLCEMATDPEATRAWLDQAWPEAMGSGRVPWSQIFRLSGKILYPDEDGGQEALQEAFRQSRVILVGPTEALSGAVREGLQGASRRVVEAPGSIRVPGGTPIAPCLWDQPPALGQWLEEFFLGSPRKGAAP
jgi:UDP-GlcNAc:undecaprenyl-phosphate GlcNAc-1-phosphate transferase